MRVRTLSLQHEPLDIDDIISVAGSGANELIVESMNDVLSCWEGTRYGSGQRCRGVLADCVGFVFGAIDDIDGRSRAQSPSMPADVALHDHRNSQVALQALRDLYQPVHTVDYRRVQPFDILVVGPEGAGPSHVMLVGTSPSHLWHCTPGAGVHRAGWSLGTGYETLHGAFRVGDRWRWLR